MGKKPADAKQIAEFRRTARELGCDEDEAVFDEKLRRIGKAKPDEKPPKPAPKKSRRDSDG